MGENKNSVEFKFKVGEPVVVKSEKSSHWSLFGGRSHALVMGCYIEEETGEKMYTTTLGDYYETQLEPEP